MVCATGSSARCAESGVRKVILAADERVDECIKWKSPTFTFNGNIASINPRAKKHISLMFHQGAKIPGTYPVSKVAATWRAT